MVFGLISKAPTMICINFEYAIKDLCDVLRKPKRFLSTLYKSKL